MRKRNLLFFVCVLYIFCFSFCVKAMPSKIVETYITLKTQVADIKFVDMPNMYERMRATKNIKNIINAERKKIAQLYKEGKVSKKECYEYMDKYLVLFRKINDWVFGR